MRQDEQERIELKREQAALRIKLEKAAMGYDQDKDQVVESDPKAEIGGRKDIDNLHTADQVVTGTKIEKDEMILDMSSPVNANTMIMNNSEMENGQGNNGSFVIEAGQDEQIIQGNRPSTSKILSMMFPCFNKCIRKKSEKVVEIDKFNSVDSEQRNKVL